MSSRRQFPAAASAAVGAFTAFQARAAKTGSTGYPYTEFEARIARRDFRDITKDVLPTPCMVIDEALFLPEREKLMEDATKASGISVRPAHGEDSQERGCCQSSA